MNTKNKKLNPEEILQNAQNLLKPWVVSENQPEPIRLDVVIEAKNLKECVKALLKEHWGYLSAITAMDRAEFEIVEGSTEKRAIEGKGNIEVLYHFCEGPIVTTLRVALPYKGAKIDSVCDLIPSATLYEREASELLGIDFVGTPSTAHLLLPDDWPADVYPLRKTFTGLEKKAKVEEK